MSNNKNNVEREGKKKRKFIGLYIIFGVALVMIIFYLIFNGHIFPLRQKTDLSLAGRFLNYQKHE